MISRVKEDVLAVLGDTIEILKIEEEKDVIEFKELSNHTLHNASIYQDEDSISVAVAIYAIYKILERKTDNDLIYKEMSQLFRIAKDSLERNNLEGYRDTIKTIFKKISEADKKFKLYVEEILDKARIKKGSRIYEHGISLARAAELLGVSQWEMMNYVGKTHIIDFELEITDARKRLEAAKAIFSQK